MFMSFCFLKLRLAHSKHSLRVSSFRYGEIPDLLIVIFFPNSHENEHMTIQI